MYRNGNHCLLGLSALALVGSSSQQCFAQISASVSAATAAPTVSREFASEVKAAGDILHVPGFAVAVVQDGRFLYRQNFGYADVRTQAPVLDSSMFSVASVTKSFTAVMLMQLKAEKRISLNDYLLSYPFDTSKFTPNTVDASTRLSDVLSMTSDNLPERTFNYSGWRYSMLSGVFSKVIKEDPQAAYRQQITSRIFAPLKLENTIDGYPEAPNDYTKRIVQGYRLESGSNGPIYTPVNYDANNYFAGPAAGIFSTIGDLATYTTALDENKLLTPSQYEAMTTPRADRSGRLWPYALGWMSQAVNGVRVNWVYGEGQADSALLVRIPNRHLSLIVLMNSTDSSSAARLHDGNVLWSPIATAFLKFFVLPQNQRGSSIDYDCDIDSIRRGLLASPNSLKYDELLSQAANRYYMATLLHEKPDHAVALLKLLYELHPQSFDSGDVGLMWLMAQIPAADLRVASARLIRSFDERTERRPEALYSIGTYYSAIDDPAKSMAFYKLLADERGFEDEWYKIDASLRLGRAYRRLGNEELGRKYIWQSAVQSRGAGFDPGYMRDLVKELGDLPAKNER